MLHGQKHLQERVQSTREDFRCRKHGLHDRVVVENLVDVEGWARIIGSENEAKRLGQAVHKDAIGARETERFGAIGAGIVWVCMDANEKGEAGTERSGIGEEVGNVQP